MGGPRRQRRPLLWGILLSCQLFSIVVTVEGHRIAGAILRRCRHRRLRFCCRMCSVISRSASRSRRYCRFGRAHTSGRAPGAVAGICWHLCRHCLLCAEGHQCGGWMWMGIGSWANRVVVLAGAPSIGQPRLAHLVCRVRLQRTRSQAANCA